MIRRAGAIALLVLPLAAANAHAAPITVNVRVEGIKKTLFEGRVKTDVHTVNAGDGTGAHKCDGTNNGASPTPGPTLVGAFDTAVKKGGLTWAGKWSDQYQDF